MTTQELVACLAGMPVERKIAVLAALSFQLTICARASYPGQTDDAESLKALTLFNELQHQITGFLEQLAAGDEERYPEDVFIQVLEQKAQAGGRAPELQWAFERALRPEIAA